MCSGRVYDFNVFQILASMTGALWAKRGERDISRGTRRAPREISRSPRLAHKTPVMQAIQVP